VPASVERVAGHVDLVGQPREDVDPVGREAVRVLAGSEFASPELEDAEGTRLALGRSRRGEADDGVGDREFGCHGDLLFAVLADPKRRGREGGQVASEIVEKASKLGGLRVGRECLEAVDHDDSRAALLDRPGHLLEDAGQAALVESRAEVLVEDRVAYRSRVEPPPAGGLRVWLWGRFLLLPEGRSEQHADGRDRYEDD
jgi:hypothetical protein